LTKQTAKSRQRKAAEPAKATKTAKAVARKPQTKVGKPGEVAPVVPASAPPVVHQAAPTVTALAAAPVAPALVTTVEATTTTPAPDSGRNALYVLMLNLLYPAVLGTIFYTFLQILFQGAWLSDRAEGRKMLYAFGVVCHYHIDFLYVYSFEVYKRFAFFVDLAVVILLYNAFAALTTPPAPKYSAFFLCFLLIYLSFLPHELIIFLRYYLSGQRKLMWAHVWMLIHEVFACAFFILCLRRPGLAASEFGAGMLLLVCFDYALILLTRTKYKKII
jgi:hypothetical protein